MSSLTLPPQSYHWTGEGIVPAHRPRDTAGDYTTLGRMDATNRVVQHFIKGLELKVEPAPAPAPATKPTLAPTPKLSPAPKPKPKPASAGACYPTLLLAAQPQNSSGLSPSMGVYWWDHHDIMEPICTDV